MDRVTEATFLHRGQSSTIYSGVPTPYASPLHYSAMNVLAPSTPRYGVTRASIVAPAVGYKESKRVDSAETPVGAALNDTL